MSPRFLESAEEEEQVEERNEIRIAIRFVPFHRRHERHTVYVDHIGPRASREPVQVEALTSSLGVLVVERISPRSPTVKRVMHVLINSPLWNEGYLYEVGSELYPDAVYSIHVRREVCRDITNIPFQTYMDMTRHLNDFVRQCNNYLMRHAHPNYNTILRTEM